MRCSLDRTYSLFRALPKLGATPVRNIKKKSFVADFSTLACPSSWFIGDIITGQADNDDDDDDEMGTDHLHPPIHQLHTTRLLPHTPPRNYCYHIGREKIRQD